MFEPSLKVEKRSQKIDKSLILVTEMVSVAVEPPALPKMASLFTYWSEFHEIVTQ